jgi:hypothetical protein|tara:strand:+ start:335 stop:523 length:189 start_codon:yes stop_codon:yes gene_type:complete
MGFIIWGIISAVIAVIGYLIWLRDDPNPFWAVFGIWLVLFGGGIVLGASGNNADRPIEYSRP